MHNEIGNLIDEKEKLDNNIFLKEPGNYRDKCKKIVFTALEGKKEYSLKDKYLSIAEKNSIIKIKNIDKIIEIYGDNFDKVEELFNNSIFIYLVQIDSQVINFLWNLYDINEIEQFEEIFLNKNIVQTLINISYEHIEYILHFDENIKKNIIQNFDEVDFYNLEYLDFNKIINHEKGIEYGLFIEGLNNGFNFLDKGIFEMNSENLTKYMDDDEVLYEIERDKGLNVEGTKPWTKKWFEETPNRKKYLSSENINFFKENGTIIGLYKKEGIFLEGTNNEIKKLSDKLSFNISIKNYIFLGKYYKELSESNIKLKLDSRSLGLIGGYLKEYGISFKYFIKDLNIFNIEIDIKLLLHLLKNRIYPTKNIIEYLEKGGKIKELLKIKDGYRLNGGFNSKNPLHLDLEYIDFRYIVDISLKGEKQVGKGYEEYLELISGNYNEKLDPDKYYKQAGKETYYAKKFIDEMKNESEKINVFPNMSYGKVVVAGIKNELKNDKQINYSEVRMGSTECHKKISFVKKNLFSKEDIKNLFKGDSIILDGSYNASFGDSNIGFKSYFYIINKVLFDITGKEKFIEKYKVDFIKNIEKKLEYFETYNYLKNIIERNKLHLINKNFEFIYSSQNKDMYLRTRGYDELKLKKYNNDSIKVYFGDFVERIGKDNGQAYFDDKHITNFKIIPTEKGFSYVDTIFEDKIKKYYEEYKEKNENIYFSTYEE